MVLRWAVAALLKTEDRYCELMGYEGSWMLKRNFSAKPPLTAKAGRHSYKINDCPFGTCS
jgi:hypothetical protein